MLSYEKVLAEFQDYIQSDDMCRVVLVDGGCMVRFWDDSIDEWFHEKICSSPEELRSVLELERQEFENYNATS